MLFRSDLNDFKVRNSSNERALSISLDEKYDNSIAKITTFAGSELSQTKLSYPQTMVDFDLIKGVYILNIFNEGRNVYSTKIISK